MNSNRWAVSRMPVTGDRVDLLIDMCEIIMRAEFIDGVKGLPEKYVVKGVEILNRLDEARNKKEYPF